MHASPSSTAAQPEARANFTPPPAPSRSWQTTELEEDVKDALALGSVSLLSWAFRSYDCHCSVDHSVHAAISYGQAEALEYLLNSCTMNHLLHVPCRGQTPLHKAVRMTHAESDVGFTMSNLLLAHGANVDAQDAHGEAPIHQGCRTCSLPAVQLLLQHGADANLLNSSSFTPLHLVCQKALHGAEDLSVIEKLLAHGAAPSLRDAYGLRPHDHINMAHVLGVVGPFKLIMTNVLVTAEHQWVQNERWRARRSCLVLRARPESGHLICNLPPELFRAVVYFV